MLKELRSKPTGKRPFYYVIRFQSRSGQDVKSCHAVVQVPLNILKLSYKWVLSAEIISASI
jgi:hypothetical protein